MTYDVIARTRRTRRVRRVRTLLALALVVGLVVCVSAYLVHPGHPRPAGTIPAPSDVPVPVSSVSVGVQPDPGTAAPMPADLLVAHIDGVDVPVSALDGPHRTGRGLASGFGHDRAGAVIAAANLVLRVAPQVGPAVFRPTLRSQVTGPNARVFTDQVEAQYQQLCAEAGIRPGGPVGQLAASFTGYRITLYSTTTALLSLLLAANQAGQPPLNAAVVVQVAWVGGDWRLVAPAGGDWTPAVSQVPDTGVASFNPFAPGR